MADNPIKYSDLIKPDSSIEDAIKQLQELDTVYSQMAKDVKDEAIKLTVELNKVSGATESGRNATRKAASEADKLAKAEKDLANAQSDIAKKIAELNAEKNRENQINKLMAKLNASAEGSYNRLSAQYSLNKIRINQMSQAERDAAEESEQLISKTRELYETMKKMQQETGKNQLNVGNYTEASDAIIAYGDRLKETLGLNNSFGDSLLALGKGGADAKSALSSIKDGFSALGKTLMTFIKNPVFLSLAGITAAGAAFKWWYDYNSGLVEATRLTQQFTNKEGDDLKNYRNEVQAVADTFNVDFNETLIAANSVAQQFGITADESLKLIKDGFIAGANSNGEFIDTLKEYPAYFKEAGISADQFIAIIAQTNKMGIFSDKGVDTIKEANLRLREMTTATASALDGIGISSKQVQQELQNGSKTTFDIMQEVSQKLSELPDSASAVGTAIADIFGGPGEDAGLQYIRTLKDISTNLEDVKGQAGELGKLQEEQMQAQLELQNALAGLFDMTGGNFETLTTKAKLFVTKGLTVIIKAVVNVINYFIRLYNESIAIRAIWNLIVANFKNGLDFIGNLFNLFVSEIKAVGTALEGLFTLDYNKIKQGLSDFYGSFVKLLKTQFKDMSNNFKQVYKNLNSQAKPIVIPVTTQYEDTTTQTTKLQGRQSGKSATTKSGKNKSKNKKDNSVEEAYKTNINAIRKLQDAQLEAEDEGFEKERKKTEYHYNRQIEDLKHQLETQKNLTSDGRKAINQNIETLENELTKKLLEIEHERQLQELETQKNTLELRLQGLKRGSQEEIKIQQELLENERKTALLKNKMLPKSEQQDEILINKAFDVKAEDLAQQYMDVQMRIFQQQQDLAQSEFDLLETTEEEKTRFRLNAEKDRLNKILELRNQMLRPLTQDELIDNEIIKNTIASINNEIAKSEKNEKQHRDIYDLIGLKLDDEQKQAISESVGFSISQLSSLLDAQVQLKEQALQNAQEEVEAAQSKVDAEIEARNNGYANDVATAQKELEMAKKNEQKALKEKQKAQKQQQALDTLMQTSSLITASAEIWKSFSGLGPLGVAGAIAAIATMWTSFAAAQIKARQVTKMQDAEYGEGGMEFIEGGSHQSGNDVDLGTMPDGRRRRAEGGEAFAIINKTSTRKYRKALPGIIKSINNGTFEKKYMGAFASDGLSISVNGSKFDSRALEKDVREIKEQGKRRYIVDSSGRIIETYKNLKRRYN